MNTKELTDQFQDWQKRACDSAKNFSQATDTYIRQNTWSTLALATILGCVVGYFLMSSRD